MLILINGNNQFNIDSQLREYKESFDGDIINIDGEHINSINEIFIHTDSISMFFNQKLIVVRGLFSNKKIKTLEKLILKKLEKTNLDELNIIFVEYKKLTIPKKEGGLLFFLSKNGKILTNNNLRGVTLQKWIEDKFKNANIKTSKTYVQKILSTIGDNQAILDSEIDKLILQLNADKRQNLIESDLDLLTLYDTDYMIWDLTDTVCNRDRKKSLQVIEKMFKTTNDAPLLFSAILKQFQLMILVKKFPNESERLKKEFLIKDYSFFKLTRYSKLFTINELLKIFNKLVSLDFATKQGKIDAKLGLNLLIATL